MALPSDTPLSVAVADTSGVTLVSLVCRRYLVDLVYLRSWGCRRYQAYLGSRCAGSQ